jgi:hypothetical protein
LLQQPDRFPNVLSIKKLTFRGGFHFDDPYVKLVNKEGKTIYNTREVENSLVIEKNSEYSIVFTKRHFFAGDMTMELKENRLVGKNLLISFVFNTAFISCTKEETGIYKPTIVRLEEMSPLGKQKQNNFEKDFVVEVEFRKFCNCGELRRIEGCSSCKGILKGESQGWERIRAAC